MSDTPILELDAVTVSDRASHVSDLTDLTLTLNGGELLVVEPERHVETVSLYDVLAGLIAPEQGTVSFMGTDWQAMGLFSQSEARGRMGRIFEVEGWVSNLNIFENIALSQRHHTTRSDSELREEIVLLCERIGLRDCLADRPHGLSRSDRRRAQWVRAFLGTPDLLLLNAPLRDVPPDDHAVLGGVLAAARARGAAVVWKSPDAAALKEESLFDEARWSRLTGGRLVETNTRETESAS